jgi:hypothetical protein
MADFNYQRDHSRALYATETRGNVKKGQFYTCHSKADEQVAKDLGFTSERYVRSEWPKTMFNKKSGDSRPIGKLEWSDAENQKAVDGLGADWTFDHVPVPEKSSATAPSSDAGLTAILTEMREMQKAILDVGDLVTTTGEDIAALRNSVSNLDQRLTEVETEMTVEEAPKKGK